MTWIKICGITNKPDAVAAAAYGANALGFVFAPSKRKVTPDIAREIIKVLPPETEKIGVFADEDIRLVREIANYCGLTGVQLHGSESPQYCKSLRDVEVIKAFRVNSRIPGDVIQTYVLKAGMQRILLDTYAPDQLGGTGKSFNWELVPRQEWGQIHVIIAGGVNAGNVAQALRLGQPFGVDVSSGVEKEPGKKDPALLKTFIERVRGL